MQNISVFSPKTERGESRSGHGISFKFNKDPDVRASNRKSEARRLQNRTNRGNWSNECGRSDLKEVPFPQLVKAA